jgi:hypothetical protein
MLIYIEKWIKSCDYMAETKILGISLSNILLLVALAIAGIVLFYVIQWYLAYRKARMAIDIGTGLAKQTGITDLIPGLSSILSPKIRQERINELKTQDLRTERRLPGEHRNH